ncbi:MAG: hypothetical protein ABII18_00605 [bacterium]|nr:hypothetical protein [bacterium]
MSNEVGRIHIERQAIQKVIYHPIHGNDIGSGYVIPLPKEYFQEDSGTVSFEEKDIELENVAYQKVPDEKGKTWILF